MSDRCSVEDGVLRPCHRVAAVLGTSWAPECFAREASGVVRCRACGVDVSVAAEPVALRGVFAQHTTRTAAEVRGEARIYAAALSSPGWR